MWWVWTLWIYFVVAVVTYLVLLGAARKWPDLTEEWALRTALFWPFFFVYLLIVGLAMLLGRRGG